MKTKSKMKIVIGDGEPMDFDVYMKQLREENKGKSMYDLLTEGQRVIRRLKSSKQNK